MTDNLRYRVTVACGLAACAVMVIGCAGGGTNTSTRMGAEHAFPNAAADRGAAESLPIHSDADGQVTFWHWPDRQVFMNSQSGEFFWMADGRIERGFRPPFNEDELGTAVVVRRLGQNPFTQTNGPGVAAVGRN